VLPEATPACLRVADTAIDEAAIAREMQHHRAVHPQQARAAAARALVVRELLRRECARLGVPDEVAPVDGESREEASIRVLLEREVATPPPDVDACRRYYVQNRERLREAEHRRVRHILLAAAPGDSAARAHALQSGESLIAQLREHPERFAEFAQRHSACPSRDAGGALGWIERGQTTAEFERQVFMLREGLAGLPVESRYGQHVVQVDEIRPGAPLAFEQVATRIAEYLELQARQHAMHQYLQRLRERYPVQGLDEIEAAAAAG
jgi:peptidyl-prolyl cis-trans isomerase C